MERGARSGPGAPSNSWTPAGRDRSRDGTQVRGWFSRRDSSASGADSGAIGSRNVRARFRMALRAAGVLGMASRARRRKGNRRRAGAGRLLGDPGSRRASPHRMDGGGSGRKDVAVGICGFPLPLRGAPHPRAPGRTDLTPWLKNHWTVPLFLALVVVVYADPLFRPRAFGGRDLTPYNYPTESVVHVAYARGRLPVWEAEISGGRPLLPNPNAGALYPARWLLSPLPFPLAMRIYPLLHWALAGVGMLLLLRRIGASEKAGWIAAVTYVFSGVSVSEVWYLHIQPGMTLLPWILWVVIRKEIRLADAAVLGALFGLDMLAGDIFTVATGIFCAGLWVLLEESSAQKLRRLGILGFGVALGALLAAPQILATALWIPQTNRGVLGMRLVESFYYSVSPWRLLELLVPYPFGDVWALDDSATWGQSLYHGKSFGLFSTLYLGAFPLFALVLTARRRVRGARWARLLVAISLAVAVI